MAAEEAAGAVGTASSGGSILGSVSLGLNVVSAGAGLLSAFYGRSAASEAARAKADALKREKFFNLNLMKREKAERGWVDMMSSWASGTTYGVGTSTYGAMMSNQAILQKEIDFQEEQYNMEIANLEKQAGQRFLGIF